MQLSLIHLIIGFMMSTELLFCITHRSDLINTTIVNILEKERRILGCLIGFSKHSLKNYSCSGILRLKVQLIYHK